jgi:hypothetical protein
VDGKREFQMDKIIKVDTIYNDGECLVQHSEKGMDGDKEWPYKITLFSMVGKATWVYVKMHEYATDIQVLDDSPMHLKLIPDSAWATIISHNAQRNL